MMEKNGWTQPQGADAAGMWEKKKKITAHPGEEQQRNCSLINANLDVLSNLHLSSMKSLGVHDLPKSSPNSDFT